VKNRYIGLAGLGFLGRGIAACLQNHGFHVIALEPRGHVPATDTLCLARGPQDLRDCEFIIETITEDFAAKDALFNQLEQYIGPEVPVTSNTSAIPISSLQANRKHPNRFAGMHWAPPAETTRLMEIIRGDQTDDATVQRIVDLALELDKEPGIVQKDIAGFVANRLAYALYREALNLLEQGVADAETIDLLCKNSLGLWAPVCGPFRWMDMTGGPALYAKAMEWIIPTLSNQSEVSATMKKLRETNAYFYPHTPEIAAEWQAKLDEQSARLSSTWQLIPKRQDRPEPS
jgi:3-hydroxybutyryl-CoA dehydrogenase